MKQRNPDTRYFVLLLLLAAGALCDIEEDSWVEPNIWGREGQEISWHGEHSFEKSQCQCFNKIDTISSEDAGVALLYYKKLVANLFSRKSMQYNERSAAYIRSIEFTVLPEQLENLEELNDPRDLDTILTEILKNARTPYQETVVTSTQSRSIFVIVLEILRDFAQLLKTSEVQFVVIVLSVFVLGWFVNRRYHIGILAMIIAFFLLFGYFITYLECNKKLDLERLHEMVEQNQPQSIAETYWYSSITNWWSPSTPATESQQEKIKRISKVNLPYCRPDVVLLLYANEMFYKQLEVMVEQCVSTFIMLKNDLPWPFNYLAPFFLLVLLGYILKFTFKYILSPKAWASLLHQHAGAKQHQNHAPAAISEDRISGDNLKMLLNAINTPTIAINGNSARAKEVSAVSGVQEILEQLENASSAPASATNSPNSSKEREAIEDITDNASLENKALSSSESSKGQTAAAADPNNKYKPTEDSAATAEKSVRS